MPDVPDMTVSAHDVAAALITEQRAAGRTVDKMQLQKLLYLVQGANLEFWNETAFREALLAYRNGPVVRVVEDTYRTYAEGSDPIRRPLGGRPERLSFCSAESVQAVLRYFGAWSAPNLERYVKGVDSPWQQVRGDLPSSANCDIEIPVSVIAKWFHRRGIRPNPEQSRRWDATDAERQVAEERLSRAKTLGVFAPSVTPELEATARRALERSRNPNS